MGRIVRTGGCVTTIAFALPSRNAVGWLLHPSDLLLLFLFAAQVEIEWKENVLILEVVDRLHLASVSRGTCSSPSLVCCDFTDGSLKGAAGGFLPLLFLRREACHSMADMGWHRSVLG